MSAASWTQPSVIDAKLERLWQRGQLLSARLDPGSSLFPLRLPLRRPDARALAERFDEVRQWIAELEAGSKAARGFGYDIVWREINHRQLGRNRVPASVVVPSADDALALIGKRRQAARFDRVVEATTGPFPQLLPWLRKRPLVALEHASHWERVLKVVAWFRDHPRPGLYLRQLEIPGVDTKFIESNKRLLAEVLDLVLPAETVDSDVAGVRWFEARYGLVPKPALIRFRLLDPGLHLGPLSDVATPTSQFARLELPVRYVFITENEVNGLSFPPAPQSVVLFGLGYGLERLAEVPWLHGKAVFYWGDIDTHGFAILDRLRASFPRARSLLMDRETLMLHEALWTREDAPHDKALSRLTEPEFALYDDLRSNRLGDRVRLEQERLAFGWVRQTLRAALSPIIPAN